ncbi:hypothetical protein ABVV53_10090 [Novosphingobium sp. RD2P27]|uniref:Flagellar motor switch protein FliN-like C-terminal domain-containing protein n=1 Tax=Novosphingobium kalidii TaxID=3230299 RepID=A0ABV2D1T4_9SPHN
MTPLTGLQNIVPAEAQLRTDLLAALNGIEAAGALLTAAVSAQAPRLTWFLCPNGISFALERLSGEPVHLGAADGVRAAECMEHAEPMLRAIEWALGVELEPESLAGETPAGVPLWLRIEALTGAETRDRIHLAIPRDMHLIASPAPLAPQLLDDVPFPAQLALSGPRLAPIDAAGLAEGDLLLLGEAPLGATITFLDRPPVAGLFEPATRRFTPVASQE